MFQISAFTNIQLPFVGNFSKEIKIQHAIINLHGRAWQRLKSFRLLVWFMRATETCSFAHACLYLLDRKRVNKNSNIQKLSCRVQKKAASFKRKEGRL
uniref:Uncharacterized protein n=1 Tax=Arundo donax TaxID=35708 RepID=A0A0A9FKU3_ARUDO